MDLTNVTYEALHRYFTRLSLFGYMKYSDVDSLIVLLYIQDLLKEDLNINGLGIINKALSCLLGNNCMIPYTGCKDTCN